MHTFQRGVKACPMLGPEDTKDPMAYLCNPKVRRKAGIAEENEKIFANSGEFYSFIYQVLRIKPFLSEKNITRKQ